MMKANKGQRSSSGDVTPGADSGCGYLTPPKVGPTAVSHETPSKRCCSRVVVHVYSSTLTRSFGTFDFDTKFVVLDGG